MATDKNAIAQKMKADMQKNAEPEDEYDAPVEIQTIPFWVGDINDTIEGFVSDPMYKLPKNFGHNAMSYEITLFKPSRLLMAVGRTDAPAVRDVAVAESVVLSTHTDLMQKMDELPIVEGYALKITLKEITEVSFIDSEGNKQTRPKKIYEVRPSKKNKKK